MGATARIARLRVASAGRSGVATARALVEDALRTTASGQDLLVVRRVRAGGTTGPAARQRVAHEIATELADARARAVRPDSNSAATAEAVLFRDEAEPYMMLAHALASGSPLAHAWFFRSVFGKGLPMSLVPCLRFLLARAVTERFAPAVVPEILAASTSHFSALVEEMSVAEAETLMSVLVSPAIISPLSERPHGRPARSTALSQQLSTAPSDLRTVTRQALDESRTPSPKATLAVALMLLDHSRAQVPAADIAKAAVMLREEASRPRPDADPDTAMSNSASPSPKPDERQPHLDQQTSIDPSIEAPSESDTLPPPDQQATTKEPAPQQPLGRTAATTEQSIADAAPPTQATPRVPKGGEAATESATRSAKDLERPTDSPRAEPRDTTSSQTAPDRTSTPDLPTQPSEHPFGVATSWAGVILLAGLMNRVLPGFLAAGPPGLGALLMDRALARAGCKPTDAARRALLPHGTNHPNGPRTAISAYAVLTETLVQTAKTAALVLPNIERPKPLVLRRVEGAPGWRALTCPHKRTVLAIWHGRAPTEIRQLPNGPIHRAAPIANPMPPLIATAERTLRQVLREETGLRMRELMERSGWIRTTRTHLDVTFDASQIDIRVRRAGLDLDLGWCPWMRQVVTVHYDFGGHDA